MLFYSWKDIDRYCLEKRNEWENAVENIEVYPTCMILYYTQNAPHVSKDVLQTLFPKNYRVDENVIRLDIDEESIPVFDEITEPRTTKPVIPLFREAIYNNIPFEESNLKSLTCPVIAFHSYKGGVGRTLSLIAFAKAWTVVHEGSENQKLLIIDSDLEAPGLTWTIDAPSEDASSDTFSYLDLLSLIQDKTDISEIVQIASSKIGTSTISIEAKKITVDHYFLPTYRYLNQFLDLYASPETIVNGYHKEYALAEILSEIGTTLGVGAILIDLRAGISELSAPILLDPRVKKYLVTSTSRQSISGTTITLKYIMKGLSIGPDTLLPEIFLSMVPDNLPVSEKKEIYSKLFESYYLHSKSTTDDEDTYTDNVITELAFASELIHLTTMDHILSSLNDRDMYQQIESLVKNNYLEKHIEDVPSTPIVNRSQQLAKIQKIASDQLTAEGNSKFDLMMTAPLKHLRQQYSSILPTTIVMGAKGSGKTFLYNKFIESGDWAEFFNTLSTTTDGKHVSINAHFLPVLATRNVTNITDALSQCISKVNKDISSARVQNTVYLDNASRITRRGIINNWDSFWEEMLTLSFNPNFRKLVEVEKALEKDNKRIIFLIDGLEDYLQEVAKSIQEKEAIRSLCQDIVARIKINYSRIGIIVFLRRDLAQNAILTNFTQFRQTYDKTELKWSSSEALRLALWLVKQADINFFEENVDVSIATQDVIEHYLEKLWGLKLGRPTSNEAYSSRWILAALSDFNGQLQARDIIRFLNYAASSRKSLPYDDRLLMPAEIRTAVQKCSTDKLSEIKDEYSALRPIFKKLESLPQKDKALPLRQQNIVLTPEEESSLVQEGYLKRDGEEYYLPEIVRHALGFKYEKGARPRVLSLLLKHNSLLD